MGKSSRSLDGLETKNGYCWETIVCRSLEILLIFRSEALGVFYTRPIFKGYFPSEQL